MNILRCVGKLITTDPYLLLGIIIGIFLNLSLTEFDCSNRLPHSPSSLRAPDRNYSTVQTVLKTNVTRRSTGKPPQQLVRPRYYSTELGIREKLFVAVLTSEEKVAGRAAHLNATFGGAGRGIKFFMTAKARGRGQKLNYTGLVGFTDGRQKLRPFQIVKYIGDNFLQEYDYYFIVNDYNYVNGATLKQLVGKISVSMNVYLGTPVKDGSYCDLDAGILLSNSVLKSMRDNLEWCVQNAATDDHSENIGRCVYHSTKLDCQSIVQGQRLASFKLRHFALGKSLKALTQNTQFNEAVSVYPVLQKDDYYMLHVYFSQKRLKAVKRHIVQLSRNLGDDWPPGERKGSVPATRFDLTPQKYFNITHIMHPDDFTAVRLLKKTEKTDVETLLQHIKAKIESDYPNHYEFRRLLNGYRTFDLSRGLDYKIDVLLAEVQTGKEIIKRFEICKPLGGVEFIPAPYVTENTKITILVPVEETDVETSKEFIDGYVRNIMERREKTLLMLVFLYQYNSSSKGKDDVFADIKSIVGKINGKYKSEDTKVAWVSIRLPTSDATVRLSQHEVLNFAMIDLTLKKVGLDALILTANVKFVLTVDFLNRVRMNTIQNFQIFSPVPFRFYNPRVAQYEKLELNKLTGHFDPEEYGAVSFYARDYVAARKKAQDEVPLIRSDNDIANVISEEFAGRGNVLEMFVRRSGNDLHCLRAPEIGLSVLYHKETKVNRRNLFEGTQTQLAKFLFFKDDEISTK